MSLIINNGNSTVASTSTATVVSQFIVAYNSRLTTLE